MISLVLIVTINNIIKDLVQECLIGLDFVNKFNGFRIPIGHLKSTLKNFTISTIHNYSNKLKQLQINKIEEKPKHNHTIQSNSDTKGTEENPTKIEFIKNKILELATSVSAPSLMDLKPSTITNHKIDLIDPQQ
ncbi:unnamed protein product [Brachionus calyciflorus]|uniref:Uncharacterized protein n=1 Tax=Brachionus calyciflorus TaxID=104777 RepID=A0A813LXB0_9BILA|nr:unnamed protein product [Brachionus calyciflorus]